MKEQYILDQSNQIVQKAEDKYIDGLRDWSKNAEHRANGCGCSHCSAEFKRADMALAEELTRIYFDSGDEEEDFILREVVRDIYVRNPNAGLLDDEISLG